jgi:hypothetical protein
MIQLVRLYGRCFDFDCPQDPKTSLLKPLGQTAASGEQIYGSLSSLPALRWRHVTSQAFFRASLGDEGRKFQEIRRLYPVDFT